jgi:predicted amidophosphoribosyltransferase
VQALQRKTEMQRATPQPVMQTTCPACGAKAASNENFCRKDGTRMQLGKACLGCQAPGGNDDIFCWQCGLKHGEQPPEPAAVIPEEDRIKEIKRKAIDLGLLQETSV